MFYYYLCARILDLVIAHATPINCASFRCFSGERHTQRTREESPRRAACMTEFNDGARGRGSLLTTDYSVTPYAGPRAGTI